MEPTPNILVLCGPTASGKTALAVALALALDGEVVSADSMQVYRGMDIGTAKPTREEMRGVPHHMLDVAEPEENYSAGRYVRDAVPVVDDILRRGKLPIIAGGTGLYIESLVAGREFAPIPGDTEVRATLYARSRTEGLPALLEELRQVDPAAAERLHPNDKKRILRALEVYLVTGRTITAYNQESQALPRRYSPLTLALGCRDRGLLRARISRRVDDMMERGLEREVRDLMARLPARCTAMQAIGYKEIAAAISEGRPVREGAEEVKLRSGQYAKRQLTWFRRDRSARWLFREDFSDFSALAAFSTQLAHEAGLQ